MCPISSHQQGSFEIAVTNGKDTEKFTDVPLYLRILNFRIKIDSRSTISYIRKTLSELDDYTVC
jgi:hypothetical protein